MARIDDVKENHSWENTRGNRDYYKDMYIEEISETLAMICDHLASIDKSLKEVSNNNSSGIF